ncbi:uncharacterized protein Z520_09729 [Fonsecaea multimorphosa CBS 102226]|uniref:F-box domain-containing protein n=1 Tax=Fonsecaea multimorphosa CBS 102226 TaxID=1442371 RepID=A0A0D2KD88_9EURO|nr:uncharacterized protein Z520_09729 [Fonsecaea multimorphosa CBS 102226]KIX94683.1 hypothetical protein Z520_09729 [Fonsecaea multimorphosa CBS 102226]OAL18785.1 hypothetical protein AYO22_10114 [Fonsecaea multimorphosa]
MDASGTVPKKGRKRLRQTLLTFSAHATSNPASQNSSLVSDRVGGTVRPSQPPTLPAEIWHRILEPLSTLGLKTMRLVCRDWSLIGAQYLFSTVYLNSYEKAWAGLRSICNSNYAPCVRRIVWNPLVLLEACLDGPVWRRRYQNLLEGLSQSEISALHREYIKLHSRRRDLFRSSAINPISKALRNLPHCYECVISDDYDLESTCLDPYVRKSVQGLLRELPGHAIWGLRPKWTVNYFGEYVQNNEVKQIMHTGIEVFKLLQHCASIKSLSVECWGESWFRITEPGRSLRKGSGVMHGYTIHGVYHSAIQNISLRLKCCRGGWLPGSQDQPPFYFEDAFGGMFSFPELRELSLEPVYTDPGPDFFEDPYTTEGDESSPEPEPEPNEDGSSAGSQSGESPQFHSTACELRECCPRPHWLTLDMMHSLYAKLDLGLVKLPKLEKLVVTNVTLDARCLLLWLCEQVQLPVSGLSICLQGTAFLFDLDPKTLFQGLAQLNVNLCYDPDKTFHYGNDPERTFHFGNAPDALILSDGNTIRHVPTSWTADLVVWSKYDIELLLWESPPVQMPPSSTFENLVVGPIDVRRRPSAFISMHRQWPSIELAYYTMPGVEGGICDWLPISPPESLTLLVYRPHRF